VLCFPCKMKWGKNMRERKREREREARRSKIEESGETANEGDKSELGWREAGRYCYTDTMEVAGRRTKETRKEKPKGDDRQVERRRKFISRRCGTMPWSNLHQGWTSTIHWRRRRRPRDALHILVTRLNDYIITVDSEDFSTEPHEEISNKSWKNVLI